MASSCQLVRDSTKRVSATALHVKIIQRRIEHAVSQLDARTIAGVLAPDAFEADRVHFADREFAFVKYRQHRLADGTGGTNNSDVKRSTHNRNPA